MKSLARSDGLVIRDLGDETLVYDRERHQAHCLNPVAASVFRLCDGERSVQAIASLLGEPADPREREALVAVALEQLAGAQLLEETAYLPGDLSGAPPTRQAAAAADATDVPRRELLRRVGTALLLPAIVSIVAPTPAQAASGCVPAGGCDGSTNTNCHRCALFGTDCSPYPGYYCDAVQGCQGTYPPGCP